MTGSLRAIARGMAVLFAAGAIVAIGWAYRAYPEESGRLAVCFGLMLTDPAAHRTRCGKGNQPSFESADRPRMWGAPM